MNRMNLVRLAIFYIIAIVVSNIFRFDVLKLQTTIEELPTWTMVFFSPLQAIGVLIGALIALNWLKKQSKLEITVFGTSTKWSLIMSVIPIILLIIIGVNNNKGDNAHYFGFVAGLSTFIYCFFEEIGWRGYLEEELKELSEIKRVLIIAILWYLWHLSFLRNPDLVQNILFFLWLLLGSWGIGKIVQITKSIFAATCFHFVINIILFNGFIKDGLNKTDKYIIFGILITVWVLILIIWKKQKAVTNK